MQHAAAERVWNQDVGRLFLFLDFCFVDTAEMEKRADSADISVLFFLIAVLIFWLYTRKQTVLFCTVLLALYY